jgi:hypothetical protein
LRFGEPRILRVVRVHGLLSMFFVPPIREDTPS